MLDLEDFKNAISKSDFDSIIVQKCYDKTVEIAEMLDLKGGSLFKVYLYLLSIQYCIPNNVLVKRANI